MSAFDDYNIMIDAFTNKKKIESEVNEAVLRLKYYMYHNPDAPISIAIRQYFFNIIKKEFLNPNLKNAFDMNKTLPYYKNITIYNNLPFINNFWDVKYYYFNLFIESKHKHLPVHLYITCNKICDKYFPGEIPRKLFSKTIDFCATNSLVMSNVINPTEKSKIRTNKSNITGSIGENYICDKLNTYGGKVFGSINNGFGFDILYVDPELKKEYLIEVKATNRKETNNNTYLELLTNNEKKVLEKTINLPNTEYIVERVHVNTRNNTYTSIPFYYDKQQKDFVEKDIIFEHANKKLIKKLN